MSRVTSDEPSHCRFWAAGNEQTAYVLRRSDGRVETVDVAARLVTGAAIDTGNALRKRAYLIALGDEVRHVRVDLLLTTARAAVHSILDRLEEQAPRGQRVGRVHEAREVEIVRHRVQRLVGTLHD